MSVQNAVDREFNRILQGIFFAVSDTHDDTVERIFNKRKDINGNDPEAYSDTPISISVQNLPRKAGRLSKTGKTAYFDGGYKQLKREIGRPPLELFGRLKNAYSTGLREVTATRFVVSINEEEYNKTRGKYMNFFGLSKEERRELIERLKLI